MAKRGRGVQITSWHQPEEWITRPCPTCGQDQQVINGLMLKWWREVAGVSLKDLGKIVGVSSPYLSDIELNKRNCPEYVYEAYKALQLRRVAKR